MLSSQGLLDPILCVTQKNKNPFCSSSVSSLFCNNNRRRRNHKNLMASNHRTNNYLRHLESRKILPSGAGRVPRLNAVILGESLATEENDFVVPSQDFANQANVKSPEQVFFFLGFV